MAKKKLPFIRMSVVFILIILAAVFTSWGYHSKNNPESGMMSQGMGEMMGENHLKEITIRDLILQVEKSETSKENGHSQHHSLNVGFLNTIHRITTITIVILVPFIIAGTIFLAIIWFDKK